VGSMTYALAGYLTPVRQVDGVVTEGFLTWLGIYHAVIFRLGSSAAGNLRSMVNSPLNHFCAQNPCRPSCKVFVIFARFKPKLECSLLRKFSKIPHYQMKINSAILELFHGDNRPDGMTV
jgi:hypothetical protein